jgi:hypothetical protein
MTNIDGHGFYDQHFGHSQSSLSTSDLMWRILRGKSMTKINGRAPKSAQPNCSIYMGFTFLGLGLLFLFSAQLVSGEFQI